MKKRFTRILAAFALLVGLTIPMGMWGQTRETDGFDLSAGGTVPVAANASAGTINGTNSTWNVTINGTLAYSAFQGSNGNKYWQMGKSNSSITSAVFSTSGISGTITSIVVNCAAAGGTGGSLSATVGGVAFGTQNQSMPGWSNNVGGDVTFNGSASGEIVITEVPTDNKACYIQSITVTYTTGGGTPTCATPTFSPEAGTYTQAQNVSISCETEGATIYYTTDGNNPTTSSSVYSEAINVSTNTTIKAMAVAEGYNNSAVATAEYTIEAPSFNQDWEGTMHGWTFVSVTGDQEWSIGTYSNNKYAKMSGYSNGNNANEDWCISPAFNLGDYTNPVLTFTTARSQHDGNELEVYFSNNYNGDPSAATWTQLTCTLPDQPSSGYSEFTSSGNISLSSYSGSNCYIGFKYTSTTSAAATWELDDIVLAELEPSITVSKQSLSGFTYVVENGPSAAQSFTVSGENLTANIGLSLGNDSNFEICETEDGTYTNSLTLTQNNGAVSSTTIYVRLKNGLSINTYEGTITLTSTGADNKAVALSGSVTEPILDYATLPFAYDGNALAANLVPGLTQNGITDCYSTTPKIKFDTQGDYVILKINERPGILTFGIKGNSFSGGTFKVQTSEDGTTYTDLAIYDSDNMPTSVQSEEFNNLGENVRYIKWIYTYKSSGNVALGNIALAKYVAPQEYTLAVTSVSNAEIIVFDATDPVDNNWVNLFEGVGNAQVLGGTPIALSVSADEGYTLESLMVNGVNHVADISGGVYTFTMPSENVTISATAVEVVTANYVKVTSTDDLTSGQYLIVYEEGSLAFDGGLATLDAVGNTIDVTIQDGEINASTAAEFTIDVTAGTIKSASGYYIGQTSNDNGMQTSTTDAYVNTISFDEEGNANVISGGAYLRYNSASNQLRFRYFKSSTYTGQKAIQLYKKVETHTIQYSVNGVIIDALQQTSPTLVPSSLEGYESYVPNGYYFKGWIEGEEISLTQEEPNIISDIELYNPTADVTLKAVFAICDYDAINCSNYCTRAYPIKGRLTNEITETDKAYYVDCGEFGDQGAFVAYNDVVTINGALGNFDPNALSIQQGGELIVNNAVSVQMNEWVNGNSWCFIASPLIDEVPAENIGAFGSYSHQTYNTEDPKYNLYFYDEPTHWWRSYQNGIYAGFNIEPGTGYLYSVEQDGDQDFQYVGLIQPYVEDGIAIDLNYTATIDGEENPLAGWNLVGNPFPFTTTIDKSFYYVINNTITPAEEGTLVGPCTGAFVRAQTTGETVTFTKAENMGKSSSIGISVVGETMRGNSWANVDKAIVSFSGSQLEKFVFDADNAKLYIPQNGMDYAIVSTEAQGELPVNFRANKNGTFTLSMDVENMDMNYLHLIDNMTGMDVDLLQTPSYTFEAKVNDYESRFRLVFAANNEDGVSTGSTTFAFYSNGSWIINNAGEATLQVVDLTGRILSSETVNGSVSKTINAVPGVYMLRLINGDNVNVQKIVVR